jgi:hypothetical protein
MTVKEIREYFKKETNQEIYIPEKEQEYNSDYVKWLEKKLADFLTQ